MAEFFEVGKTYQHDSEGIFEVKFVGKAPAAFEYHSETLGVAFGWRKLQGTDGSWEGMGGYETADFHGWSDMGNSLVALSPTGVPLVFGLTFDIFGGVLSCKRFGCLWSEKLGFVTDFDRMYTLACQHLDEGHNGG